MTKDRSPVPKQAAAPAPIAGRAPKPNLPRPGSLKTPGERFDPTVMASLLFRDAAHHAKRALRDKSPGRDASLLAAVGTLTSALRAISNADAQGKAGPYVQWGMIRESIAMAVSAAKGLDAALSGQHLAAIRAEFRAELGLLTILTHARDVDAMLRIEDPDELPPALSLMTMDQEVLCRQALYGAHQAIAEFRQSKPGKPGKPGNDHDEALMACMPIPQHLAVANDAATSITNRHERLALTARVESLSQDLDHVAQMLTMTPKHPWETVFARMFDGENQLRRTIGLVPRPRPYTGTIDPQQAVHEAKAAADGVKDGVDYTKVTAADPQTAVNAITIGLRHSFAQQAAAVVDVERALQEPQPPRDRSTFDTILGIVVNVALGGVAGAIGGALADRLKRSLEAGAKDKASVLALEVARVTHGSDLGARTALRKEVMERMFAGGAIYRATAVDGAKDATKALFRESTNLALQNNKPSGANAAKPLNAFLTQHTDVLLAAQLQAELQLAHLAPALGQLDLETLNQLMLYVNGDLQSLAKKLQYDSSMREWQNFKAHLRAPAVNPGAPGRDVETRWATEGVLEATFLVDATHPLKHARPKSVVLRGAEPRAIEHFKRDRRKLDQVGINTRFIAEFEGHEECYRGGGLVLGVGPDHGLQKPDDFALGVLKVIALNRPVLDAAVFGAALGALDHMPDATAMRVAKQLLAHLGSFSTVWLEG